MPPSTPAQGKRGAPESGRAPTTSRTFALTPVHRDKLRHRFRKTSQTSDAFEQEIPICGSRHTGKHREIVRSTFWPAHNGVVLPLTMMVNGVAVGNIDSRRQKLVDPPGPGFVRLTVMDATGAADTVVVRIQ